MIGALHPLEKPTTNNPDTAWMTCFCFTKKYPSLRVHGLISDLTPLSGSDLPPLIWSKLNIS